MPQLAATVVCTGKYFEELYVSFFHPLDPDTTGRYNFPWEFWELRRQGTSTTKGKVTMPELRIVPISRMNIYGDEYTYEETSFLRIVDKLKQDTGKKFLSYVEVFRLMKALGYRKIAE